MGYFMRNWSHGNPQQRPNTLRALKRRTATTLQAGPTPSMPDPLEGGIRPHAPIFPGATRSAGLDTVEQKWHHGHRPVGVSPFSGRKIGHTAGVYSYIRPFFCAELLTLAAVRSDHRKILPVTNCRTPRPLHSPPQQATLTRDAHSPTKGVLMPMFTLCRRARRALAQGRWPRYAWLAVRQASRIAAAHTDAHNRARSGR